MTILFSPIGNSDAMSLLGDGPMLHIVRHRNPGKIVLFLSPKMAQNERADKRYTKAIQLLSERLGRDVPEIELIESDYEEVYRFDYYIEKFENVLKRLIEEPGDAPILVNASSGTPAMEQAVVALGAFGHLDLELLQVKTPREDTNKRHDRMDSEEYDTEFLWDNNKDNDNQTERNRIIEVESPNFRDRLLRENVIELIKRYDYEAAESLAGKMRSIDSGTLEMIRAASSRLNLSFQHPSQVFGGTELRVVNDDSLLEYLYVMEVRLAQGHYADFIRSMTPALFEIMNTELAPSLPKDKYSKTQKENGKPVTRLDPEKIEENERLKKALWWIRSGKKPPVVENAHLICLVNEFCEAGERKETIEQLREIERSCRNNLAHSIERTDIEKLEKDCGMPLDEIMKSLFMLHGSARPGMYDRINEAIIERL